MSAAANGATAAGASEAPRVRTRPRGSAYDQFLSWASLNWPGFWRFRIDVLLISYAVLIAAAALAPTLFGWLRDDYYMSGYGERTGFSPTVIYTLMTLYAIAAVAAASMWTFYIARAARLQDTVVKPNAPAFLWVFVALTPIGLAPLLAGLAMFGASFDAGLIDALDGSVMAMLGEETRQAHFPGLTRDDEMTVIILIISLCVGILFAISIKTIIVENTTGLLRSIAIAVGVQCAVIFLLLPLRNVPLDEIVPFDLVNYSDRALFMYLLLLLIASLFMFFFYQKDIMRGVRLKTTRAAATAYAFTFPVLYTFGVILVADSFFNYDTAFQVALYLAPAIVIGLIIQERIMRGIARLSLLPRP